MPISFSILVHLIILSFFAPLLSSATHSHHRHILHQPFFPLHSLPPTQSPNRSPPAPPPPDYPFTGSSPSDDPFFPESSIPPPPPPPPSTATFASFPANISSLTFPHTPKSSTTASPKLVAGAIAAVVAAVLLVSFSIFLHFRKRRRSRDFNDTKTHRSDNSSGLQHTNSGNSCNVGIIPKLQRPSQLSSEFLYLGTLVNSHGAIDNARTNPVQNLCCTSITPAETSTSNPRRMSSSSPELRPLPPLNRKGFPRNDESAQLCSCSEDDNKDGFAAVGVGNFGGPCSCSSYSSSSSASGSPVRSISLSTSPPVSLSPERSRIKSPELVSVQLTPPPRPSPPPVIPSGSFSRSSSRSPAQSPPQPSRASPARVYNGSRDSSPKRWIFSDHSLDSPLKISSPDEQNVHISVPSPSPPPLLPSLRRVSVPPPPPPVPSRACIPRAPSPQDRSLGCDPPVLVTPVRPMSAESPALTLPPSDSKDAYNSESIVDLKENSDDKVEKNVDNPKPKLKPLHWDKVRASSDCEMVWDQLKSSSFKLNEEMIETLFIANAPKPSPKEATRWSALTVATEEYRVLDPKKSQNIAILLRALNVTVDEVCDALVEGKAENLGTELLESLLKMAPTKEEERKLKEHKDDSPVKLGAAEKFLKAVLEVPFAFRRVEIMLYMSGFESEVGYLKKSFETLEAACEELRNSRIFLKLLEAVLKTGNRMNIGTNRGDARAFKLDTLLKLVDVKGTDGKTTLLHFVVQEIIKREGACILSAYQNNYFFVNDDAKCLKLGLQAVSALSSDLINVKKAAAMDSDVLNSDVLKLSSGLRNIAEVVQLVEATGLESISNQKFSKSMNDFMIMAEEEIIKIQALESVALSLVKEITEYFHGNSAKEEAHPLRIFMVVRDFLTILDRVCKEVGLIHERTTVSSAHKFPIPVNPTLQQPTSSGFPARQLYSSSDDESSSP